MSKWILLFLCVGISQLGFAQSNLSLNECRKMALDYNQQVRSANLNVEAAEKKTASAKTNFFPKLDGNSSYSYVGHPINPGNAPNQFHHYYNVNAILSQSIYSGGVIKQTFEIAKINENIRRAEKDLTDNEIMLETDQIYWTVVSLKEKLRLSETYRNTIGDLVNDIQNKVDAEVISRSDLLQTQVRYNSADLLVLKNKNTLAVWVMALNRMIGVEIMQDTKIQDSIIVEVFFVDSTDMTNRALVHRPEIMIQEGSLESSKHQIKLTASSYNPNLEIGFKGLFGSPSPDFTQNPAWNYNAVAKLSVPIFYSLQRRKEVSVSKLFSQVAELQLEQTQELVTLDVQRAKYNFYESIKQYNLANSSLADAVENLDIITDRYVEGLSPILDVLNAQVYWQLAFSQFIDAKTYYKISYSELQKALGEYGLE